MKWQKNKKIKNFMWNQVLKAKLSEENNRLNSEIRSINKNTLE